MKLFHKIPLFSGDGFPYGGNKKIFSPDSSNKCDQKDPLQSLSLTHHPLPPVHSIHFSSSSIFDFGGFRKNLCCLYALSFINIGQSILQIRLEIRFSLHWPEPFGYPLKEITAINMFLMAFKVKPCSWRSQNSWWWSWTWHWKSWDHRLLIAIVLLLPMH